MLTFPNGIAKQFQFEDEFVDVLASVSCQQVGNLVRRRRLANHLTQRELSELAGVGVRVVSELERGKSTLRMDVVNRVLAAFGLMLGPVEAPRDLGEA